MLKSMQVPLHSHNLIKLKNFKDRSLQMWEDWKPPWFNQLIQIIRPWIQAFMVSWAFRRDHQHLRMLLAQNVVELSIKMLLKDIFLFAKEIEYHLEGIRYHRRQDLLEEHQLMVKISTQILRKDNRYLDSLLMLQDHLLVHVLRIFRQTNVKNRYPNTTYQHLPN